LKEDGPKRSFGGGAVFFEKQFFGFFRRFLTFFFLHLDIDTLKDLFCEEKFHCLKRLFQILTRNSEIRKTKAEKHV
jgi:hypothetical protein